MYEQSLRIAESKLHLKSDSEKAIATAIAEIRRHRRLLLNYIKEHPEFQNTLQPIEPSSEAPEIVRIMTEASKKADVGPMASVAGALADVAVRAMLRDGARVAVVEDGGEIAVVTDRPVVISIVSAYPKVSGKIGLRVTEKDCPLGVATSSSKTGHALSFGEADSVTILAENAALADAAATAVCNSVVGSDVDGSIRLGLEKARGIKCVRGVIIVREGRLGLWGKIPEIVRVK